MFEFLFGSAKKNRPCAGRQPSASVRAAAQKAGVRVTRKVHGKRCYKPTAQIRAEVSRKKAAKKKAKKCAAGKRRDRKSGRCVSRGPRLRKPSKSGGSYCSGLTGDNCSNTPGCALTSRGHCRVRTAGSRVPERGFVSNEFGYQPRFYRRASMFG